MAASEAAELDQIQKALGAPARLDAMKAVVAGHPAQHRGEAFGMARQILILLENGAPPAAINAALTAFRAQQALHARHCELEVK